MARPLKKGIDYFPIEVDIDEDDKFFDLFDEYGTDKGLGIVIILLSNIYKHEGYYMKWNDSICKKISRKKHIDREELQEAVSILTGTSKNYSEQDQDEIFFNTHLYKTENILSSSSIQKRFFIASDRRKERQIVKQYLLLSFNKAEVQTGSKKEGGIFIPIMENSFFITIEKKKIPFDFFISGQIEDNTNNNIVNVDNNLVNDNTSTQTKLNQTKSNQTETKLNKIKSNGEENKGEVVKTIMDTVKELSEQKKSNNYTHYDGN